MGGALVSAAFTPGKWVANRCGPGAPNCWNVIAELGENERGFNTIRTIDQVLDYCGAAEAEANARLIAAAPDGYEAAEFSAVILRMLVAQLATFGVEPACNAQGAIDKLEAFTAKARGDR